jgi:hypothetical protein
MSIDSRQQIAHVARINGWQRVDPGRRTRSEYRRGASWLTVYYAPDHGVSLAEFSHSGAGRAVITGPDRLARVLAELRRK